MPKDIEQSVWKALETFQIEIPSWGFANTGTRFGKFLQSGAASTIDEKFADAAMVHQVTGACPSLALHVLWDFADGLRSVTQVERLSHKYGIQSGAINPNVFQDQQYKHGSLGNPDERVRRDALDHILESIEIGKQLGGRDVSLWFADGSNYPGSANIRARKAWFTSALETAHSHLAANQRMLVEYKPFEPAFYHTDIADWGMAFLLARAAGPQAFVLVDTGHHYQAQNIEQIVAWLLSEDMLGGFHFNDRRYADDDLTLGSIDPYQVFRIFHEIRYFEWETGERPEIAYMIDQSHNLKLKIEATIQTVAAAQELYAKAALVDHESLRHAQQTTDILAAEECLKAAFSTDVRPAIHAWREAKGLPADPLIAYRESGYQKKIELERGARNMASLSTYA
jgi:L-rhamnose isomerase / sugar isomerase